MARIRRDVLVLAAAMFAAWPVAAHHGGDVEWADGRSGRSRVRHRNSLSSFRTCFSRWTLRGQPWTITTRWTPTILRDHSWSRDSIKPGDKVTVTYRPHIEKPQVGQMRRSRSTARRCRCPSDRMHGALALALVAIAVRLDAQPAFAPHDLAGHWDRTSPLESFANTPGGTRDNEQPGSREAPFTAAGRAAFDGNKPGYGPRRAMARNDPMGRCEPLGLVRNLVAEIVAPHATFEIVQTPTRLCRFSSIGTIGARSGSTGARCRPATTSTPSGTASRSVASRATSSSSNRRFRCAELARQARLSALGGHARRGALPTSRCGDARARRYDYRS